jgi:hypothetical protein
MSVLSDWLDMSGEQQTALLQEDLEERLAARHRRDGDRANKFGQRRTIANSPFLLDSPVKKAASLGSLPLDAGRSDSLTVTEQAA